METNKISLPEEENKKVNAVDENVQQEEQNVTENTEMNQEKPEQTQETTPVSNVVEEATENTEVAEKEPSVEEAQETVTEEATPVTETETATEELSPVESKEEVAQEAKVKTDEASREEENPPMEEEDEEQIDYSVFSKEELIAHLQKTIDEKEASEFGNEADLIKVHFYKKRKAEIEQMKKKFIEEGGEEADFKYDPDELEEQLKELIRKFKAEKALYMENQEKENL